jgi:DNA polymerase III epsilon subunit-like protein
MENQQIDTRDIAWVIADTETPGLLVELGICEIALCEIDPLTLETLWEIDSLIDPQNPIPAEATAIHGITDEMVADEPTMDEFIEHRLKGRFDGRQIVVIAHNTSFDVPRLHLIGDITASVCTLFHSRQLIPKGIPGVDGPENHKLTTLREYFGFPENEAHRALADVYTTKRLLREILGRTERTLPDFLATMDTTVHRMPWGKHCGKLLHQVPKDYLLWMKGLPDLEPNLKKSVLKVLKTLK